MVCPYCGTENRITAPDQPVREQNFAEELARISQGEDTIEILSVHCDTCGAETQLSPNVTADVCPFCGAAIVAQAASHKLIKPQSLLPFYITRDQAITGFQQWLRSRWFAPGNLYKLAQKAAINGTYLPYWTYDSNTLTAYTGQRGDDYWVTQTYTSHENGRAVTRTRQARHTRWSNVSGHVINNFDDVLIVATDSLPRHYVDELEPWDLQHLVSYSAEYLGGFITQSYDVDLTQGFERARGVMDPVIRQSICDDIGGDHQRITWFHVEYNDITFKHLLLPIWISAYQYMNKSYRFLVNARTGEVQGERPYSWIKITFAIILATLAILLIVYIAMR